MSVPDLVEAFYSRIFNTGDLDAIYELLTEGFSFRGALGNETRGREPFKEFVRVLRAAIRDYHCEILDCIAERDKAFAKVRFSGLHTAPVRGFEPTGKPIHWLGFALFRFEGDRIDQVWVLGDLAALDAVLQANQEVRREHD